MARSGPGYLEPRMIPYRPPRHPEAVMLERGHRFQREMDGRRSVRMFSVDPVPRELIELAIMTGSTAPSGAHQQPWTFVAVGDPEMKRQIRIAAEEEERQSYEGGRMPAEWLAALAELGTDWRKPHIEDAPYVIVVLEQVYGLESGADGTERKRKHYYSKESVGIAVGLLLASLHGAGLATLTHTPSPMGFLARLLDRPANERPFVLIPVGYPSAGCTVPDVTRKRLDDILVRV